MTQPVSSPGASPPDSAQDMPPSADRGRRVVQIGGVVVILALLTLFAFGLRLRASGRVDRGPAPDFSLQLFNGDKVTLSDLQGQPVVLNFWASWCKPCAEEAPVLEEVWRSYKDQGVVFIGIDYVDTEPDALAYLERFDITYPNGPDLGTRISTAYRMQGVPETFFITKDGNILDVYIGALPRSTLIAQVEQLLQE